MKDLQVTVPICPIDDQACNCRGNIKIITGPNDIRHVTLENVASKGGVEGLEINAINGIRISDVNANGIIISGAQEAGVGAWVILAARYLI